MMTECSRFEPFFGKVWVVDRGLQACRQGFTGDGTTQMPNDDAPLDLLKDC